MFSESWISCSHNNPTCQEEESQNHKYLACGEINTEKDENSNYYIDTLFETEEKVFDEHGPEEMTYNVDNQVDDGAALDDMINDKNTDKHKMNKKLKVIDDKEICENMLVKETFSGPLFLDLLTRLELKKYDLTLN